MSAKKMMQEMEKGADAEGWAEEKKMEEKAEEKMQEEKVEEKAEETVQEEKADKKALPGWLVEILGASLSSCVALRLRQKGEAMMQAGPMLVVLQIY